MGLSGQKESTPSFGEVQSVVPEQQQLQQREEALAAREVEVGLAEARLRGHELHVAALGQTLTTRGAWIDAQVERIAQWAAGVGLEAEDVLHGLGGGAALEEADLDRYVDRSETLLLGRAAMIATRAEVLQRRDDQLRHRDQEVVAFEQAFVRAEVRLTARERLLREAIARLQQAATHQPHSSSLTSAPMPVVGAAPVSTTEAVFTTKPVSPTQPQPGRPGAHRHAPTVSMSSAEHDQWNSDLAPREESSPPVLDFSADGLWPDARPSVTAATPLFQPSSQPSSQPSDSRPGALALAGYALQRSAVEVDRTSRVVLASFAQTVHLTGRVDLVGKNHRGDVQCFPVRVQLAMPGSDGAGSVVVLSAAAWSVSDFENFEAVLAALP